MAVFDPTAFKKLRVYLGNKKLRIKPIPVKTNKREDKFVLRFVTCLFFGNFFFGIADA